MATQDHGEKGNIYSLINNKIWMTATFSVCREVNQLTSAGQEKGYEANSRKNNLPFRTF